MTPPYKVYRNNQLVAVCTSYDAYVAALRLLMDSRAPGRDMLVYYGA